MKRPKQLSNVVIATNDEALQILTQPITIQEDSNIVKRLNHAKKAFYTAIFDKLILLGTLMYIIEMLIIFGLSGVAIYDKSAPRLGIAIFIVLAIAILFYYSITIKEDGPLETYKRYVQFYSVCSDEKLRILLYQVENGADKILSTVFSMLGVGGTIFPIYKIVVGENEEAAIKYAIALVVIVILFYAVFKTNHALRCSSSLALKDVCREKDISTDK